MTTQSKQWTPEQVQELRTKLGDSQAMFAKRLGVSRSLVISWERPQTLEDGTANPHYREPSALAKKLFERLESEAKKRRR